MTGLLDQVMELPTLPEFVAELEARFAAEQESRRKFYAQIPDGAYSLELKSGSGWVRSQVVTGFALPIRALFDAGENLTALRTLLASKEPAGRKQAE